MAKKSSTQLNSEENQVSIDQSVASGDYDSIIAELQAQLEAKTTEVEQLKSTKPKAARAPKDPNKVAAPTRTLESVIAAQLERPFLYALKRMVVASLDRAKFGQEADEAVTQVAAMYESVTRDIVHEILDGVHEGKDSENAILAHLEANYPKVMQGHPRGPKAAKSEESSESAEAGEATAE